MRKLLVLLAAVLAALVVAVPAMAQTSAPERSADAQQVEANRKSKGGEGVNVRNRGSDTTFNVILNLASLYNFAPKSVNEKKDQILTAPPQGSSTGIEQLQKNNPFTGFARSSREPREGDEGLKFTAFARDGIVPVTFGDPDAQEGQQAASVGLEDLTIDQLRGIFVDCTIQRFNDPRLFPNNPQPASPVL